MSRPTLNYNVLEDYLSEVYGVRVEIASFRRLGEEEEKREARGEIKRFGYGIPYLIEFKINGERRSVVLETVRPGEFGHEHYSDRAQIILWQYSSFNKLPKHVKAVDVGAFTRDGSLKSLGDCVEFFILTELAEGQPYYLDLERIKRGKILKTIDLDRCRVLSEYIAEIHSKRKADGEKLYVRRVRELIGHGECIMGLTDSYPSGLEYVDERFLKNVEKRCIDWRWRLKKMAHRCSQVHGDFHPWNILFREGIDFTVLDRSRGEWGEPADDVAAMTINYLFYSLQTYGELKGPFKDLFNLFWEHYLNTTGDEEILRVIQPFYAWRGLVIASPVWYPTLPLDVRVKIFNFIRNILEVDEFDMGLINSYLE